MRSADFLCAAAVYCRKDLDLNRQQHFETAEPQRKQRHSIACSPATPPREFFCPISKCLMTEPVLLLNTGVTLSRTALQAWLRTGATSSSALHCMHELHVALLAYPCVLLMRA
jgi:hypothetical protein